MSSQRESPTSDIPSDSGLGTLSIRDKSLLKRNINKHHNNNMRYDIASNTFNLFIHKFININLHLLIVKWSVLLLTLL